MHAFKQERQVLDLADVGLPEVPVFGRYEYCFAHPGLATHSHPGAVEICYLERGCQTYRAGGRDYHLVGGDVFFTAAGEPHDTGGNAEDRGILYWLNLTIPNAGESFLLLPAEESAELMARLSALPERQFLGRPVLKKIFNEILGLCEQPKDPLLRIAVANQLVCYVLEIIDCAHCDEALHRSPVLSRIAERIRSNPERDYSLAALADEAGLSLSRFKTKFKAQMGFGPHEFILRCKMQAAKQFLLNGEHSVTATAMELGFSSSQYFATVFKRFTQQTPVEFCRNGPTTRLRRDPAPARR